MDNGSLKDVEIGVVKQVETKLHTVVGTSGTDSFHATYGE